MDQIVNLKMVDRTNIIVREEANPDIAGGGSLLTGTGIGGPSEEKVPGLKIPLKRQVIANLVPILKALVIITLFLLNGIGFSPLGCKTQYLLTRRFWFNKQIVIFFIIYFIINLGGQTVSKMTDPIQQVIISIFVLLFYNVIARLGGIWWNRDPWYWPGPMTWFGAVALPLIAIYILDDMRRYYMAENAIFVHSGMIDNIKYIEIAFVLFVLIIIGAGFFTAIADSKKLHGKYFSFLAFFFGIQMGLKKTGQLETCNKKNFAKIKNEIKLGQTKNYTSNTHITKLLLGTVGAILFVLVFGYLTIYKNMSVKMLSIFRNELRNQKMGMTRIA